MQKYIFCFICLALTVNCPAVTRYVSLAGGQSSPYTNWVGAATTIQSAISASAANPSAGTSYCAI